MYSLLRHFRHISWQEQITSKMTTTRYGTIKDDGVMPTLEKDLTDVLKMLEQKSDCEDVRRKLKQMKNFVAKVNPYAIENSTPLSPKLDKIMAETSTLDLAKLSEEGKLLRKIDNAYLRMISFPSQVQLLQFFVRNIKAKNILEIGMFTGYSACGMADAMAAGGKVTGIEIEPVFCDLVNKTARENNLNVEVKQGKAIDILRSLADEGQRFDLIYIDCVKVEYLEYYKIIMDTDMLSNNGLIVCDNVLWSGRSITRSDRGGAALNDFSQAVSKDRRVISVMLPCLDGTLLIQHNHDK